MSRRAVTISYEMLEQFFTKGHMFELVECIEGLPKDAILVETLHSPFASTLIMVFDSIDWHNEPSEQTIECPACGIVPVQKVEYKRHYADRPYEKVLEVEGDRFKLISKTPITVMQNMLNVKRSIISHLLAMIGEWQETEEWT